MVTKLNPQDVLKLVANDELRGFSMLLGLGGSEDVQREDLIVGLATCSHTRVLKALISINGIWIRMMRDILRFMERHGVSLRTTGCLLTLPMNDRDTCSHLAPQVCELIAAFDESAYKTRSLDDWEHAETKWQNDLSYWVHGVIRDGEPFYRKRQRRDIVRVYLELEARSSGRAEMYERVVEVDRDRINRVFSLWRTLEYLANKLTLLSQSSYPAAAVRFSAEVADFADRLRSIITDWGRDREIWDEINRYVDDLRSWSDPREEHDQNKDIFCDKWWQYDDRWDEWKRFIEDVLSLATLTSSRELSDLLRLDMLKDRPRLFEVWCMCRILSMYSAMGCGVELQSLTLGQQPIWNLNYSRASEPVARIETDGNEWWLFFQLFQKGPSRSNMPDLALLRGRRSNSDVMWIADPKYSEAGGYSRADYLEVAGRYRDTFKADHVWICEFFGRRGWFGGACSEHVEGVSILTEVQPDGEGIRVLNRELRRLHGFPSAQLVLAIDCSGSFSGTLWQLAPRLEKMLDGAEAVICFADSAKEVSGSDFAAVRDAANEVGGGTRFAPLLSTLRALPVRDQAVTHLVLISDEGFSDSTDESRKELEGLFAHVETAKDEGSLLRIAAALGVV